MTQYGFEEELKIYLRADPGARLPIGVDGWRARAQEVLAPGPWGYLEGSAGAEDTAAENRRALERWRIRPRFGRNVEDRDLSVTLCGQTWSSPLLIAPLGVQSILHPEAERATARAAARLGIPFVLSTVSSVSMEEVAREMGDSPRWFQLYPSRSREVMESLVSRAEAAGYSLLVVTMDTTMLGWRVRDLQNAYLPFLEGAGIANYVTDPAFRRMLKNPPEEDLAASVQTFLSVYVNPAFNWEDLAGIRRMTRLPMVVKGLTHPDDVRRARDAGADAVAVSNHGGRQVDGALGALDALAEISVQPVGVPLLMDSGIRTGADVFKALALGAQAVLVGRPYAYGLAVGGSDGVERVMRHLRAEFDLQMALAGYRTVPEIGRDAVTWRGPGG